MTSLEYRSYAKPRRADDPAVIRRAGEIAKAGGWPLAFIGEDAESGQCYAVQETVECGYWWPIDA